jgi:hypothetical protein
VEDRLVHVERRRLLEILEVVARGESAAVAEIVTTRTSGSSAAERSASASAEYIAAVIAFFLSGRLSLSSNMCPDRPVRISSLMMPPIRALIH